MADDRDDLDLEPRIARLREDAARARRLAGTVIDRQAREALELYARERDAEAETLQTQRAVLKQEAAENSPDADEAIAALKLPPNPTPET